MGQLDIRVKVVGLFTVSMMLIFIKNPVALLFLGACSSACLLSLKKYRVTFSIYALILFGWVCSLGFSWLLGQLSSSMKEQSLVQTVTPFLRMWPLTNMGLAVSLSMEVGHSLGVLKKMRLPRIIYLPVMVALRFIPGFMNDVKQLRDCLLIRGIPLGIAQLFVHPLRTVRLLFVPLVIRALRLADELAIAAELKRVGYGKGPQLGRVRLRRNDHLFLAGIALALFVAWNLPDPEPQKTQRRGAKSAEVSQRNSSANLGDLSDFALKVSQRRAV